MLKTAQDARQILFWCFWPLFVPKMHLSGVKLDPYMDPERRGMILPLPRAAALRATKRPTGEVGIKSVFAGFLPPVPRHCEPGPFMSGGTPALVQDIATPFREAISCDGGEGFLRTKRGQRRHFVLLLAEKQKPGSRGMCSSADGR